MVLAAWIYRRCTDSAAMVTSPPALLVAQLAMPPAWAKSSTECGAITHCLFRHQLIDAESPAMLPIYRDLVA